MKRKGTEGILLKSLLFLTLFFIFLSTCPERFRRLAVLLKRERPLNIRNVP